MMTIIQLLEKYGIEYAEAGQHHHARPGWIAVRLCPFCGSDNFHLGYNTERGYFSCWKCGGLRIVRALTGLGVPFPEALAFYKDRTVSSDPPEKRERTGRLVEPPGRGPLLRAHRDYLRGRGFDPDRLAHLWDLEGIGHAGGRFSWRVYIPIAWRGKRVSWTTRSIGDQVPLRYLSASAEEETVNHRDLVYGLDLCRHTVVIVEGPADAWAVGPGAGALFGIDFSPAQTETLSRIPRRFICFDSSPEAQARAGDLASQLASLPGMTSIVTLDAEDPGRASGREIRRLRRACGLDPS